MSGFPSSEDAADILSKAAALLQDVCPGLVARLAEKLNVSTPPAEPCGVVRESERERETTLTDWCARKDV